MPVPGDLRVATTQSSHRPSSLCQPAESLLVHLLATVKHIGSSLDATVTLLVEQRPLGQSRRAKIYSAAAVSYSEQGQLTQQCRWGDREARQAHYSTTP